MIHTELSLEPEEFESYQVGVDSEVTFCLKELRVGSGVVVFTSVYLAEYTVTFNSSWLPWMNDKRFIDASMGPELLGPAGRVAHWAAKCSGPVEKWLTTKISGMKWYF